MYQDKTLTCRDCGAEFAFTAGEQEYYARHGLANEPRRCRTCRAVHRETGPERCEVVCANCGAATVVSFRPRQDRPVFCRECFKALHGD